MELATHVPAPSHRRSVWSLVEGLGLVLPPAIIAGFGYFFWIVFYPGLLSYDSIDQYRQAVSGVYTTARPPVMSLVVAAALRMGGDIQHVMFVQCLACMLGIYFLAVEAVRFAWPSLSRLWARWAGLVTALVLLTPISPLPFYLMVFWTDVWVMTTFCWTGALWLHMMRRPIRSYSLAWAGKLFLFLTLSVLMVTVRHNSLVVLPLMSVLIYVLVRQLAPRRFALVVLLAPGLLYSASQWYIKTCFHVVEYRLGLLVLAHELTGLCVRYPELKQSLPHTAANLTEGYDRIYYPGNLDLYGNCVRQQIYERPDTMIEEYRKAVLSFPSQLARIKFEGFRQHFVTNPCFRFNPTISANEFGLAPSPQFSRLKDWMSATLWRTFENPRVRWVFVRHGVWFAANALALVALGLLGVRREARRCRAAALILLVPLGYYLSFFMASLSCEFRYMYPSSLFLQATLIAYLVGSLFTGVRRLLTARRAGPLIAAPPVPIAG